MKFYLKINGEKRELKTDDSGIARGTFCNQREISPEKEIVLYQKSDYGKDMILVAHIPIKRK